jgi:hypothetical protein
LYARLIYAELSVYPDILNRVTPVLEKLRSELGKVKGLSSYTLFHHWERGEVGIFALWETKEDEMRAWEQIKGQLDAARDVMWRGRPLLKLFDVYEHRTTARPRGRRPTAPGTPRRAGRRRSSRADS